MNTICQTGHLPQGDQVGSAQNVNHAGWMRIAVGLKSGQAHEAIPNPVGAHHQNGLGCH